MGHPSYKAVRFDSADQAAGQVVRRYDRGELKRPTVTPEGFIRAEGYVGRAGVFTYRRPDGTPFTELRHPDEVFDEESIRSFDLVPLTLEHPPQNLLPGIVRDYQVGQVGTTRRDGDLLRTDILITHPKAIEAANQGVTGLSGGYDTMVFSVPGTWTDETGREHRFDSYQTKIRGNHVAQTRAPRLGGDIRMRLDSADAVQHDEHDPPAKPGTNAGATVKYKLGDQEFDIPDALNAHLQQLQVQVEAASKQRGDSADLTAVKAELDRMRGELAAATADLKTRQDSQRAIDARKKEESAINERAEIIVLAAPLLGKKPSELSRMDSMEIMREVVKAESPETPIEGESDAFVRGIFKHIASRTDSSKAIAEVLNAAKDGTKQTVQKRADAAAKGNVAKEARNKMLAEAKDAWKTAANSTAQN